MTHRAKKVSDGPVRPVLDLQHRWAEALLKADTESLDAILEDTYVDTDESGSRLDKPAILAALKSGDLELDSITLLESSFGWHVGPVRGVPGQADRAQDTFYSHDGSAKADSASRCKQQALRSR